MIEAEIYGMIPSAKSASRPTAPPANTLKTPSNPLWVCSTKRAS